MGRAQDLYQERQRDAVGQPVESGPDSDGPKVGRRDEETGLYQELSKSVANGADDSEMRERGGGHGEKTGHEQDGEADQKGYHTV